MGGNMTNHIRVRSVYSLCGKAGHNLLFSVPSECDCQSCLKVYNKKDNKKNWGSYETNKNRKRKS
jgi:hypothetical protein